MEVHEVPTLNLMSTGSPYHCGKIVGLDTKNKRINLDDSYNFNSGSDFLL